LKEVSTGTVLKDDPEVIARLVPVIELKDVSIVFKTVEDFDLLSLADECSFTSFNTFLRRFFSTDLTAT
jgi:hypothetical protein